MHQARVFPSIDDFSGVPLVLLWFRIGTSGRPRKTKEPNVPADLVINSRLVNLLSQLGNNLISFTW
jgi:hypothetical protein